MPLNECVSAKHYHTLFAIAVATAVILLLMSVYSYDRIDKALDGKIRRQNAEVTKGLSVGAIIASLIILGSLFVFFFATRERIRL